jgi:hypothetical protein
MGIQRFPGTRPSQRPGWKSCEGRVLSGSRVIPHSPAVHGSRHGHMRELCIHHQGRPYRVLYAFDPRRVALLLLGGDKTGDDRWYERFVPVADRLYDDHLEMLRQEGLSDG